MADSFDDGQPEGSDPNSGRLEEARGLDLSAIDVDVADAAPEILMMQHGDPFGDVPAKLPKLDVEPMERVSSSKSLRSNTQYSEVELVADMEILDDVVRGDDKDRMKTPVELFTLHSEKESERARKILAIDEPPMISDLLKVHIVQPEANVKKARGFRNSTGSAMPLRKSASLKVVGKSAGKLDAEIDISGPESPKSPRKNSDGDADRGEERKQTGLRKVSSMVGSSLKAFQEQHLARMGKSHSEHLMRVQKWLGGNVINEADMDQDIDTAYITDSKEAMERQWKASISDVEMRAYRRVFAFFDRKRECMVPAQLLASMMRTLGMNPTTSQVTEIELEVDNGGDKMIDFAEFVHAMERAQKLYRHQRQDVIEAFHFFDDDKTGDITLEKLKYLVMMSGEDLTIEEIDMVLEDADLSGDGRLDFFEFSNLMCIGGLIQFEVKQEAVKRIQHFYRLMKRRKERAKENLERFEITANERAMQTSAQRNANGRFGTM